MPKIPFVIPNPELTAYAFLGAFIGSTFLLQWIQSDSYPASLWLAILFCFVNSLAFERTRRHAIPVALGITASLLSVQYSARKPGIMDIGLYANGNKYAVTGYIADDPDRRPMQTKYAVEAQSLMFESGITMPVRGKILASDFFEWPEFFYGDTVKVEGKLERPQMIGDFEYGKYLSRFGIFSIINFAKITPVSSGGGNRFMSSIFAIKRGFEKRINRIFSEPHASFLAGLLTGSRRGIPDHLMDDFNTAGLTHIIAISGYNITIIISVITGLLFWLPLKWRFAPSVLAIILFTIFVGAGPAVVRASIMGILGLIALQTNRIAHSRLAILWTLSAMLTWNPKYLWYDAGFQLSFLAVIGITELSEYLDRFTKKIPAFLGMRSAFKMTIAAQIFAVPLIVLLFGRFSLIAPAANILAAPAIPFAMLFGFVGASVSFIYFPLGQLFAFAGWAFLEWIIIIARILSKIPFASVDIKAVSMSFVTAYYIALAAVIIRAKTTTRNNKSCLFPAFHELRRSLKKACLGI